MLQRLLAVRNRVVMGCVLAAAAVVGTAEAARADNIVTPGSTFGFRMFENGVFTPAAPAILTFNGGGQVITGFNGGSVTVTPTQTDLGNGKFEIEIVIHSDTGLFPTGVGDPTQNLGYIYVGSGNNPLQLTRPFGVTSELLSATGPGIGFPIFHDFVPDVNNLNPWDGYFPLQGASAGFVNIVGLPITTYDLTITGVLVPLPPAFAGGIVLLGAMAVAKLRGRKG